MWLCACHHCILPIGWRRISHNIASVMIFTTTVLQQRMCALNVLVLKTSFDTLTVIRTNTPAHSHTSNTPELPPVHPIAHTSLQIWHSYKKYWHSYIICNLQLSRKYSSEMTYTLKYFITQPLHTDDLTSSGSLLITSLCTLSFNVTTNPRFL